MRAAPLPELVLPARSRAPAITGAPVSVLIVDQRGQALAQDLFPRDLRVPVAGALFGVPIDRAQQRVDIDERPPIGTRQQIHPLTERGQVLTQH